jgi:Predicted metal-binding protein (DUF2103)
LQNPADYKVRRRTTLSPEEVVRPGLFLFIRNCYRYLMPKPRGREHSSLTETAEAVVYELKRIPGIKMIAPGEIRSNKKSSQTRYVTANFTTAGFELLISGQSIQKVAIHTDRDPKEIFAALKERKKLRGFIFKERDRKPGV